MGGCVFFYVADNKGKNSIRQLSRKGCGVTIVSSFRAMFKALVKKKSCNDVGIEIRVTTVQRRAIFNLKTILTCQAEQVVFQVR